MVTFAVLPQYLLPKRWLTRLAGRAAGMVTVAAAYGFCGDASRPEDWGADHLIAAPLELLELLGLRSR